MTPPRSQLRPIRSRHVSTLGIFLLIGAFTGCTPVSTSPPDRDAHPQKTRTPATAEEVYRSYIDASNEIDLGDPETFEPLAEFTSPRFYATSVASLTAMSATGQGLGGRMKVASFRVSAVRPDQSVEARTCLEVSEFPTEAPDIYEMRLEFTPVDGELVLDSELGGPRVGCSAAEPKPTPIAPVPGATGTPGTPTPDDAARERDGSCISYPGGLTICGG